MYVQCFVPELAPACVTGELLVHVTSDGQVTLGHSVYVTASEEQISIGATCAMSLQDGEVAALAVLRELLRVLPTLVDAPPFD